MFTPESELVQELLCLLHRAGWPRHLLPIPQPPHLKAPCPSPETSGRSAQSVLAPSSSLGRLPLSFCGNVIPWVAVLLFIDRAPRRSQVQRAGSLQVEAFAQRQYTHTLPEYDRAREDTRAWPGSPSPGPRGSGQRSSGQMTASHVGSRPPLNRAHPDESTGAFILHLRKFRIPLFCAAAFCALLAASRESLPWKTANLHPPPGMPRSITSTKRMTPGPRQLARRRENDHPVHAGVRRHPYGGQGRRRHLRAHRAASGARELITELSSVNLGLFGIHALEHGSRKH